MDVIIPYFSAKTQDKIQKMRSLTIAMLPAVARDHGFQELQFLKVSNSDRSFPALLVLDGNITHSVSIVNECKFVFVSFLFLSL